MDIGRRVIRLNNMKIMQKYKYYAYITKNKGKMAKMCWIFIFFAVFFIEKAERLLHNMMHSNEK